jgi:predicted house-cleaning noncanonical NTP pyrophosphatase (MazG superfamily)
MSSEAPRDEPEEMQYFALDKIVRDGIYDSMIVLGQDVNSDVLLEAAMPAAMKKKILEEAGEFKPDGDKGEAFYELADILEAVETAAQALGMSYDELRALQLERREKRGGFSGRRLVRSIGVTGIWAQYYAGQPERFRPITKVEAEQSPPFSNPSS